MIQIVWKGEECNTEIVLALCYVKDSDLLCRCHIVTWVVCSQFEFHCWKSQYLLYLLVSDSKTGSGKTDIETFFPNLVVGGLDVQYRLKQFRL